MKGQNMDDPWNELTQLSWHETIDKANEFVKTAETSIDCMAHGMAFVILMVAMEAPDKDIYECVAEMVLVWRKSLKN